MNARNALREAEKLFGDAAWVERYPAKKTKVFGELHVACAQFAIGRMLRNGGREVCGRGLSWEEALDNAKVKSCRLAGEASKSPESKPNETPL